ncbi:TPA: hypothetical protein ACGEPX_002671 [Salmonella enterica]
MKYLSLQQAMLGMRVTMTDDGLILKSPAGSAHYDLKGRRHTVWGDTSFFPEHLRVKDKRKPKCGHVSFGNGEFGKALADLSPFAMKDGQVFIKDAFIQPGTTVSAKADSNSGGSTTYNCNMRISVGDRIKQFVKKFML